MRQSRARKPHVQREALCSCASITREPCFSTTTHRCASTRACARCVRAWCFGQPTHHARASLAKKTGAHSPSRIKKGMSAAVLFRRVSMNGLVSHGPNERAENGPQHPSAHVKCADNSIANGNNKVSSGRRMRFTSTPPRGRKTAVERLQNSIAAYRLPVPAGSRSGGLSRFSVSCHPGALNGHVGAFKNSGPSPSARARTPNADVACRDDGVGSTTEE